MKWIEMVENGEGEQKCAINALWVSKTRTDVRKRVQVLGYG
jgi:hypothetical protein